MPKINIAKSLKGRTGTQSQGVMIKDIPIDDISIKKNVRAKNDVEINELAKSIEAVGLLQPISVIKDKDQYQCLMGHRRLLAYKLLYQTDKKYHSIKSIVTDKKNQTIKQVTENIQRENLTAMELYTVLKQLKKEGYKLKEISELFGKSLQTIKNWSAITNEIDTNKDLKKTIKGTAGSTFQDITDTKGIKNQKQRIAMIKARASGKATRENVRKKPTKVHAKGTAGSTYEKAQIKHDLKSLTINITCSDKDQYKAIMERIKGIVEA